MVILLRCITAKDVLPGSCLFVGAPSIPVGRVDVFVNGGRSVVGGWLVRSWVFYCESTQVCRYDMICLKIYSFLGGYILVEFAPILRAPPPRSCEPNAS